MYDIAIIGGGILGVTAARMLSKYNLNIAVLEKNYDIGEGSSKSNSGILAAGFHPRPESLKAISCVKGNEMYREICKQLDVPVNYLGSLMVAYSETGQEKLREKLKKGTKNHVPGLKLINGDEARKMEPLLSDKVIEALYCPTTAVVDVFKLLLHNAQLASLNGVEFLLDTEVTHIDKKDEVFSITTNKGEICSRFIINTAGENADLMEQYFHPCELEIKPRRGEYYVFEKENPCPLHYVIYQAQDTDEKGCLITPTIDGNIITGPTSEDVDSYENTDTSKEGLDKIERVAKKMIPSLDMSKVITSFAGVRANITNIEKEQKDFIVRKTTDQMVSALGIKNPGITSAPYLCQLMIELLESDGLCLQEKETAMTELHKQKNFFECSKEEQQRLLKEDKDYAKVICRCEKVTLGDIKRVLNEPLPPTSMDGIKRRLRVGMGKCQGGFCVPELLEILSREWNVPVQEICKSVRGSELAAGNVK